MTTNTDENPADLPCHRCEYDLRAHPRDGTCPECGASVAESVRLAAFPRRPAWHQSDPRWRRRILAGTWVLVLLPLMDALGASGWAASIPAPNVFSFPGAVRTLEETLLASNGVYNPLIFCVGVVLLFARERGRRPSPTDWTRRWGVGCSYVVLLLSAAQILFISALVLAGIAALFQSMPPKYQPAVTQWIVDGSAAYLHYGPYPKESTGVALIVFSSITILLACVPLFAALRSAGSRRTAAILLAPLAAFALLHLVQVGQYLIGVSDVTPMLLGRYRFYFDPNTAITKLAGHPMGFNTPGSTARAFLEAAKWCAVLAIAARLTVAQIAAQTARRHATHG